VAWSTLHTLDGAFLSAPGMLELLVDPAPKRLRVLVNIGGPLAVRYAAHPATKPIEELMIASRFHGWSESEPALANAFERTSSFPRLRHLGLDLENADAIRAILASPVGEQLEKVSLSAKAAVHFRSLPTKLQKRCSLGTYPDVLEAFGVVDQDTER
jgi:hypothetical protein